MNQFQITWLDCDKFELLCSNLTHSMPIYEEYLVKLGESITVLATCKLEAQSHPYTNKTLGTITALPLNSVIPKKHIKPNNKLANKITDNLINKGEFDLVVSKRKSKIEIITKVMLAYEEKNVNLERGATFTSYDRVVHDAVITLYHAGNEIITPEMVYRTMNGLTASEKISPQSVCEVTSSLEKSRFTLIKIDFTQEAHLYKKECKSTYEGFLLACDKITVSTGGRTKEAYRMLRKPILFEYAQISKQILTVPMKY